MNNMEQHFGDLTPYIQLEGLTPVANSMPMDICFLGKKFKKVLKQVTFECNSYMNVCFDKEQNLAEGTVLEWSLHDDVMKVYVIGSTRVFVKGKPIWAYCVGIIE